MEVGLSKSNAMFESFGNQMTQLDKKTKKLDKENRALQAKNTTTNKNLLDMIQEVNYNVI